MYECRDCGDIVDVVVNTYEGEVICESCYADNYSTCDECGTVSHNDNTRYFDEHFYCESCYDELVGYCQNCDSEVYRDDLTDVGSNVYHWVCPDCLNDNHTCRDCGDIVESLYDGLCEGCCDDSVDGIINSYGYKPTPKFFGEGDRFFGVELETEPLNEGYGDIDMVREVQELVSEWAYLKHDGSLNEGGFEVVTHPMTLENHLTRFTPELFKTIKSSDYVSHTNGNCGLHIHISRSAFKSDLAIVKLLEFVYGNYDNIVSKLGRRHSMTSYCRNIDRDMSYKNLDSILYHNNKDRYHAVNTKNYDTIELRFFRGTLIRDTFVSALQFADVLVNLANKITDISQKIEWSDVYLEVIRLGYNELSKEMEKRLDLVSLVKEEYEGYKIFNEIEAGTFSVPNVDIEPIFTRYVSDNIIWTDYDTDRYSTEVLDEFNNNYINRFIIDSGNTPIVPIGTFVQVMPLTMMKLMCAYGCTYPSNMREFAGGIYRISNNNTMFKLDMENGEDFVWDRSSFRVLSGQELVDMGLV